MVSRANNIKSHWAGALVAPLEATHAALARPSMHSDPIDPHASIGRLIEAFEKVLDLSVAVPPIAARP